MSATSIIDKINTPTDVILANFVVNKSMDHLKKIRFSFGKGLCKNTMLEIIFLERLICNDKCYISTEDEEAIRERLLQISILELDEL